MTPERFKAGLAGLVLLAGIGVLFVAGSSKDADTAAPYAILGGVLISLGVWMGLKK